MSNARTPRVLQRVRILFVLAVLIPLGMGAWLSYRQVESSLVEQSFNRSYDAARFHGTLVLDQLIRSEYELELSGRMGVSVNPGQSYASDILYLDESGDDQSKKRAVSRSGYPPQLKPPATEDAKSQVYVSPVSGDIYLAGRMKKADGNTQAYLAKLAKTQIFGSEEDQLLTAQLCLADGDTIIYCTSELESELSQLRRTAIFADSRGRFQWSSSGHEYLASTRQIFLPSHFDSNSWDVIVVERDDVVFAPIRVFRWMFPAVSLLALCVLLFLVLNQTRRQLGPVVKLKEHAERVGRGNFETRLELKTRDEFEVLAGSLNGMAEQLGDQFHFLQAMSEIDSALLNSIELSQLCETILTSMAELLPNQSAAILSIDARQEATSSLHTYNTSQGGAVEVVNMNLSTSELTSLVSASHQQAEGAPAETLQLLAQHLAGDGRLVVHPLKFEERILGALCLRLSNRQALAEDHKERLQSFKDRLTVALSTLERQRKLYFQAHFDQLTGLPNRMLFLDRLDQYFAQAQRQGNKVAVVYADLDKFKLVNDTLGHERGDQLLEQAANRFSALVRGSDTVARLSGDEFALALPSILNEEDVSRVMKQIVNDFKRPFILAEQEFHIDVSMGVGVFPDDGDTAADILKKADIAMYRVKSEQNRSFLFFEERMNKELRDRTALVQDLKKALHAGGLSLVYQPKVDAGSHLIQSVEALIRWKHPDQGWVSPTTFIPIAEDAGLIPAIGEYALNAACSQFAAWRRDGLPINQIAVNVSPRQIQHTNFFSTVEAALAVTKIPPTCLELEITEDLLIEDYEKTEKVLASLSELGVGVALDDFGTGYSSLSHIHELSFDTLKIDKCFVDKLGKSESSDAIVKSIVALGMTLNKKLVAEGVEDIEQLEFLTEAGCHLIQGYYFSKPLSGDQITKLLVHGEKLPANLPLSSEARMATLGNTRLAVNEPTKTSTAATQE